VDLFDGFFLFKIYKPIYILEIFHLIATINFQVFMSKISFKNDYSEGAHPQVLQLLLASNSTQEPGYGEDSLSLKAKEMIAKKLNRPNIPIYLVTGGTQANLLIISHVLKSYESVIAVDSSHIQVHETGAIEHAGHKINLIPQQDGKLTVTEIQKIIKSHKDQHMVKPRLVYISQTTELGSLYSKKELIVLYQYCQSNNLLLFIDGARMAISLTAKINDLTLEDIANYCDVFYFGATKNGGLLGEAIVFSNTVLADGFEYALKQKGALLAKGRILGAQFYALFQDSLYEDLSKHANETAERLANVLVSKGYTFYIPPYSNQLFPILPKDRLSKLAEKFEFYIWQDYDEHHSVIRLVCSWATESSAIDEFIQLI